MTREEKTAAGDATARAWQGDDGEKGGWQRFATEWAIVFTDSTHLLRGRVRFLGRNATSAASGNGAKDPMMSAQDRLFRVSAAL